MAPRRRRFEVSEGQACPAMFILIMLTGVTYFSWHVTSIYMSRNHPIIYLNDIHVSSLNKTFHSSTNTTTIYFDLKIQNDNSAVGVYYDDPVKLTFTYFPPTATTKTHVTIGEYTIPGFYQGNGKAKQVQDFVVVKDVFSEDTHRRDLGEASVSLIGPIKVVVFRVDLDAKIKFKSIENKKSEVVVGAFVEINGDTGNLVQNRTTVLKYASSPIDFGFLQYLLSFIFFLLLFACSCTVCVTLPAKAIGEVNRSQTLS